MRSEKQISRAFKRYARKMFLFYPQSQEKKFFLGFLQPLRYKNKMYLSAVSSELGFDNTRKFLLVSTADTDLSEVDGYESIIVIDGDMFCTDHSELIYFCEKPMYRWSIVHQVSRQEEEDEDT